MVTPAGFRDVMPEEALRREQIIARVQTLIAQAGYLPVETPTLERMSVLERAGLVPDTPFRLFDSAGNLLGLRPDVTMQVARMCATRLRDQEGPFRFRYTQRVFRDALYSASREVTQLGLELIGASGPSYDAEIVGLFVEALRVCELADFRVALGTVGPLRALLETCPAADEWKTRVLAAYHASDFIELAKLTEDPAIPQAFAQAIAKLPFIRGGREAIEKALELTAPLGCARGLQELLETFDLLTEQGIADFLLVDLSIMSSFDYYTGIVFEAFCMQMGSSLGSGGRYDGMLNAYGDGRALPAGGFAFSLEAVMASIAARDQGPKDACAYDAADCKSDKEDTDPDSIETLEADCGTEALSFTRPLRIAIPKGSLNADTIDILTRAGLDTQGLDNPGRQLIIHNPGVDYIIVRPTDAPVFVAQGAADCGICGKDSLIEADMPSVGLVDLGFGACRFVVAEPIGATPSVEERYAKLGSIRVATKYPRITQAYYDRKGVHVDIVKLHGNIELAPLTGMSERIVDITATGTTLKENNLCVVDEVLPSTARFFANACAFRLDERVLRLSQVLQQQVKELSCDA